MSGSAISSISDIILHNHDLVFIQNLICESGVNPMKVWFYDMLSTPYSPPFSHKVYGDAHRY